MKILVLCLGNPILSDDGVGLLIGGKLKEMLKGVDVITAPAADLDLLESLEGYERVFLVDALTTRGGRPGEIKRLDKGQGARHLFSSHGMNFFHILELGRQLGRKMPDVGGIYGIEIGDQISFGEGPSRDLGDMLGDIIERIAEELQAMR